MLNTISLVACGGKSSRMGTEKHMLQYYQKPQCYHLFDLLLPFCTKVFISCNDKQSKSIDSNYPMIIDDNLFSNIGPMAALLTAFTKYPHKNILMIGCDYPFITASDLAQFNKQYNLTPQAYYNTIEDLYEPLLAWYPFTAFEELNKRFHANQYSLQHFLKESNTKKIFPKSKVSIKSVDTPQEFTKALSIIKKAAD